VVDAVTALVLTVKVAVVASGGNRHARRYAGRPVVTSKRNLRTACGAGPLSVTVPVEEFPRPVTLVGFSETEERETDAAAEEDSSKSRTAGLGSFCETATNFEGEII